MAPKRLARSLARITVLIYPYNKSTHIILLARVFGYCGVSDNRGFGHISAIYCPIDVWFGAKWPTRHGHYIATIWYNHECTWLYATYSGYTLHMAPKRLARSLCSLARITVFIYPYNESIQIILLTRVLGYSWVSDNRRFGHISAIYCPIDVLPLIIVHNLFDCAYS